MRSCLLTLLLLGWSQTVFAQFPHNIPDFCASPTRTATVSGNWSNTATWGGASVPAAGAVVVINNGVTVTYDANSPSVALKSVCINGLLDWGTTGTKYMVTSELMIEADGELRIGTEGSPFIGSATVEFDGTLDTGTVPAPGLDPEQFGLGLIVMGKIRVFGDAKTPFVRLASAVSASATSITLQSTPTNWDSGDTIYLPESTQRVNGGGGGHPDIYRNDQVFREDTRTLTANVTTTTANMSSGTTYAHPCSGPNKDGGIDFCPHAANLTRNIRFISADPGGLQAHGIAVEYADVNIQYAAFEDMGRTTVANLNCTLRTTGASQGESNCTMGTGAITQIGTNQKGRYAFHFHHVWGPNNPGNTGYQGVFRYNVITRSTKWPLTLHFSNYLHIADNVITHGRGPAIFGEEYGEHFNVIERNFMASMTSNINPRAGDGGAPGIASGGREACGIWLSGGTNNTIRDNVATTMGNTFQEIIAECGYKYFIIPSATSTTARVPNFRGARLDDTDEYTNANPMIAGVLEFSNNEAYGMGTCMTIWHLGITSGTPQSNAPWSTLSGLKCWNVWEYGFYMYPMYRTIIEGMVFRGNVTAATEFAGPQAILCGDYRCTYVIYRNCDLQGTRYGIGDISGWEGSMEIDGLVTYARVGIQINPYYTPGTVLPPSQNRRMMIRNFSHTTFPGVTAVAINKSYNNGCCGSQWFGATVDEKVDVIGYQGTNQNFRVYYSIQGTTNVAGGQAPCNDSKSYSQITGAVVCEVTHGRLRMR